MATSTNDAVSAYEAETKRLEEAEDKQRSDLNTQGLAFMLVTVLGLAACNVTDVFKGSKHIKVYLSVYVGIGCVSFILGKLFEAQKKLNQVLLSIGMIMELLFLITALTHGWYNKEHWILAMVLPIAGLIFASVYKWKNLKMIQRKLKTPKPEVEADDGPTGNSHVIDDMPPC